MLYFLRALWVEDGLTQRDLSNRVGFSAPTTLEQLRKMEKHGLITMERDVSDRRKSKVILKPEAKRLKVPLLKHVDEMNRVAFSGFSAAETETLRHMLERVRENIRGHLRRNRK